ncbi:hypothetical protein ABNM01_06630 [Pseudomonas syringae]|uniref:hypothetical protein n=1 Tax=Pseudomonas syringae group TaxID=136849 RepID=UPI0001AF4C1E|nr:MULTISPECIES: hypothetical protein [Pseudomonas syringae group]MCQ3017136.1 hypothetical protein [Pseudomonas tremae]QGL54968.1 hypothetical protein POR16_00785 [Pseudomonas coronafaciens pv. oryzae str. 1_6]
MNLRALAVAALAALSAIGIVCVIYILAFGTTRSADPAIWGQFGDYVGGVLNPLFGLAAFLSALWSVNLQQRESRAASMQLAAQTDIALKELDTLSAERLGEEFLHVIRDIDQRLSALLLEVISPRNSPQAITITQMVAEADRIVMYGGSSPAFAQFLQFANAHGSVVEAPVREIKHLVNKLQEFLEHYSKHKAKGFAPILVYYADKAYRLMNMLEAVGGMPPKTREFFATISDSHR